MEGEEGLEHPIPSPATACVWSNQLFIVMHGHIRCNAGGLSPSPILIYTSSMWKNLAVAIEGRERKGRKSKHIAMLWREFLGNLWTYENVARNVVWEILAFRQKGRWLSIGQDWELLADEWPQQTLRFMQHPRSDVTTMASVLHISWKNIWASKSKNVCRRRQTSDKKVLQYLVGGNLIAGWESCILENWEAPPARFIFSFFSVNWKATLGRVLHPSSFSVLYFCETRFEDGFCSFCKLEL